MLPQSQQRKKKNSSKMNLLISFVFHAVLILVLVYFAARSGILGHQLQRITVQLVKKPPEKPKPPPPPKVEPPKVEPPKVVATPKLVETPKVALPSQPVVAPPPTELPSFDFNGGKAVETSSDPVQLYKGALEYAFLSQWNRPNNMADDKFVAEVQVSVARNGEISNPQWEKGSGNSIWDDSVRKAIAAVKSMSRPPPTNFPSHITVRFDVQEQAGDDTLQ